MSHANWEFNPRVGHHVDNGDFPPLITLNVLAPKANFSKNQIRVHYKTAR